MRKAKKLSNKLMAILLSASMVFAPAIQSMPVYAAEPVIEEESADTLTDNTTTTEPATDNNDSDTPAADNCDSDNQGTENGDSENLGTENGDSDNSGTENGDPDNSGTENGDSENPGTENGDSETPGTEDGDTENPEDPNAEDGDSDELGDAEADESLGEDVLPDDTAKTASVKAATVRGQKAVNVNGFSNVGGWNESIYAEIANVDPTDVVDVEYSGTATGKLSAQKGNADGETALDYLVRKGGSGVRIDIPGLKAGTYTLTVTLGSNKTVLKQENINVYAYDRSGYAHFKYTDGVGAYKDDGTLKNNAIVLYVNDDNKNTVTLTVGNTTVTGIGNILNSVGKECGEAGHEGQCKRVSGKKTYYGKANDNQGIITKLSEANIPLVVRFIGAVSDSGLNGVSGTFDAASTPKIDGLTIYDAYDNGGSPGDNGHMARIQSGKNITLEGIGYDAAIDGWGFHFMAETSTTSKGFGKSFEVRNLKFVNTPEDAVGMEGQQSGSTISAGVERCWVHNNSFYCPKIGSPAESDKSEGDGSVDFKRGMYFTCSYNYFDSCHKTNLVGSSDSSLQFNLTYHHNYWYMCKARGPLTRQANVHMYNNIFDMQTDYAMNTRANAYIFSEYNLFYACKSPQAVEAGAIKSWNDSITSVLWNKGSAGTFVKTRDEKVNNSCAYNGQSYSSFDTDPSLFYYNNYALHTEFEEMRKVIVSQTGTQKQNPKLAASVDKSEYSVVDRMAKNINNINITTPFTDTPGKISKAVYAFEVDGGNFDLEVEYATGSKAIPGVLVNEEGENLLEGDGGVLDLEPGKYMIQALTFQPGDPTKGTIAVFKDFTINSLKISAHDENAHVHKYELDSTSAATCTEAGKNIYKCTAAIPAGGESCSKPTREEVIPALGHAWPSNWTVTKEPTATESGSEERICTRCNYKETREIKPGGTGGGSTGGGSTSGGTVAGDYVLTFEGKTENDDADFFTVKGNYTTKTTPVIVNDTPYKDCLKMESSTNVSFTCNEGATLTMVFGDSGKKVKVNGTVHTTDSNGWIIIENLAAGSYSITKGDSTNLFYLAVANAAAPEVRYTILLEYNYDDAPDAKEVSLLGGLVCSNLSDLVPASFTRKGYKLIGLYKDALCTQAISIPYTVNGDDRLYADWEEETDNEVVDTFYSVKFDSNGGNSVATAKVSTAQIYKITESTTKAGYSFAGWYTEKENGILVDVVDGSALTGDITLYAHWNPMNKATSSLDCSKDLDDKVDTNGNIIADTEINGFTIHALPGGKGGTAGAEDTKYYMTLKENDEDHAKVLYTNGLLLTDKSIAGNNDGLLKSIEFTAPASSVLTVDVASSSSKGKTTCLVLAQKDSDGSMKEVDRTAPIVGKTKTTKTFDIVDAGTYYLYPAADGDKGVVYYRLEVTEPQYTIVYKPGIAAAGTGFESVMAGKDAEITLPQYTAADGYEFKGWSLDGVTKIDAATYTVNPLDATESNVIVITALYDAKEYTVKYDKNGGTLPENLAETAKVHAGDSLTPGNCTPPDDTYRFVGWKVGDAAPVKTYLVKASDADGNNTITIKADYEKKPMTYTLRYDVNGGALPEGAADSESVVEGNIKNLPECIAPAGKQFIGWTKDGAEGYLRSYTVKAADADKDNTITLKAAYADENEKYYNVRLDPKGGTLKEGVERISRVKENEEINPGKCTSPNNKQRFIGWAVNNQLITLPYKVTEDVVLVAQYGEGSEYDGIYIIGLQPEYQYTGAKIIPDIGVMDYNIDDGKLLAPGVDYTVKYKNNVKPGTNTAIVTITGKGNYANMKVDKKFSIKEVTDAEKELEDLKGAKIAKIDSVPYTGDEKYPDIVLTLNGKSAVTYTYIENDKVYKEKNKEDGKEIPANVAISNNVNKGTATILLTGKEGKNKKPTTVKKTFKITAIDLKANESKITVDMPNATYAVKGAVLKSITVKYNGETLKNGTDYTVKYSSNKKAGKDVAKVTITGKGNYAKTITRQYSIDKLNMSELKVDAVNAYAGLKPGKVTATVLDKDGNALKPSQYTLVVCKDANGTVFGTELLAANTTIYVKAVAKDKDNLVDGSETALKDFAVGTNIAKAKFVLKKDKNGKAFSKQYTGEKIELNEDGSDFAQASIKVGSKNENLRAGTDYYIASYSNNINKGTATAIIVGKGAYSGTKTVKFKIVGQEVKQFTDGLNWDDIKNDVKSFMNGIFN